MFSLITRISPLFRAWTICPFPWHWTSRLLQPIPADGYEASDFLLGHGSERHGKQFSGLLVIQAPDE